MAWYKIPGYEVYSIDDETMKVRNDRTGRIRKESDGRVVLSFNGKDKSATIQRILYAALHELELDKIPSDVVFVMECGKITVCTRKELARKSSVRAHNKQRTKEGGYEKVKEFVDTVLECRNSGDFSRLYDRLYDYRKALVEYSIHARYILNEQEAFDLVDIIIERTFEDIKSGSVIVQPFGYMLKALKGLKAKVSRIVNNSKEYLYEKRRFV